MGRLASSIHTIYRPLARSRRENEPVRRGSKATQLASVSDVEDEQPPEEPVMSEEEIEEDFEPMGSETADPKRGNRRSLRMSLPPLPELDSLEAAAMKQHPARSGSMATVKLQRRARLAEKLKEIFEVQGINEVVAGEPEEAVTTKWYMLNAFVRRNAMLALEVYMSVLAGYE